MSTDSQYDALKVETDGAVARLVLARPHKHNAFDDTVIAALTIALQSVGNDPAVVVRR